MAIELEVVSRKVDRFGWDKMPDAMKDRLTADWVAALDEYQLDHIQKAISAVLVSRPNYCPNEGHVVAEIKRARHEYIKSIPKPIAPPEPSRGPRITKESAAEIVARAGYSPKRFGAK